MSSTTTQKNTNDNTIDQGHVYYFEPNDTGDFGKDQDNVDVPLTAHLEDLCVSMTLTADMYPRKKKCIPKMSEANKNDIVSRSISWISYVNGITGDQTTNAQILNAGVKMGDEKYLTTYYTEISADSYIENEMVEGLGVTGVNISYESWYTPVITINFVDVHGSSLWGREEAIHDKDGNITSDTLLGVFFQQPYPLFRLQVKGFLGHEVTYQLSVSSFNGRYNSQTGNFEATATFIGYSYSLLTDMPMKLLAYVPEMSYVGKQYWDEHESSDAWKMINADGSTSKPIKLYQLVQNIQSAITSINAQNAKNCDNTPSDVSTADSTQKDTVAENRVVSLAESSNVANALNSSTEINAIETALNSFINECKKYGRNNCNCEPIIGKKVGNDGVYEEQLVLILANGSNNIFYPTTSLVTSYQTLRKAIDEYNERHSDDKFTNGCKVSSSFHSTFGYVSKASKIRIKATRLFKVSRLKSNWGAQAYSTKETVSVANGGSLDNLKGIKISNISIYDDTAKQLEKLVSSFDTATTPYLPISNGNGFGEYAYLIPLGKMRSQIATIKQKIAAVGQNTENRVETKVAQQSNSNEKIKNSSSDSNTDESVEVETMKKKIIDIIGFEPTIGNFVKLVMCHLETFVEVMMHCADQIYMDLNSRTPDNFNLNLEATDIPDNDKKDKSAKSDDNDSVIWPWPALYNPKPKENSETNGDGGKYEMLGWTNDYPPKQNGIGWEEQKVILSALDAIQRYEDKGKGNINGTTNRFACLPMTGTDLSTKSPFVEVAPYCDSIENIMPYLGLRIANIIGIGDNQCSSRDAEAIGYMDALNLISASGNYTKLKNAVTSKETNQDFATQVIDYLTCSNRIKSTSESEKGYKYNLFEFITKGEGFYYNDNRHPMFVEDSKGYKYTYTYTTPQKGNTLVSVVPTELHRFSGKNSPYLNRVFDKGSVTFDNKKILSFTPKVNDTKRNTGINQWFAYNGKSSNVKVFSEKENYTNEQIFAIMTSKTAVETLLNQIKSLKEGETKFKGYTVKNDNELKSFIDRRFKVSLADYYNIYNGSTSASYRVILPAISKANETYYKEHMCNTADESSSVKFDNSWSDNTATDLYKKTTLSVKEAGVSFKNGSTEYDMNDVVVGEIPIMTNSNVKCSLFGSRLFYQQNELTDNASVKKAKAYLLVSAMMAGIDISKNKFSKGIFKTNNCSLIDYLPPFYVYFIGALLWRKSEKGEPLKLDGFSSPTKDYSFISSTKNIFYLSTSDADNWNSIEKYYMKYENIDIAVKNKLINEFEKFANSQTFQNILDACELKTSDGYLIGSAKWKELNSLWTKSDFDAKNPSQWVSLFSNIYGNYSSITIPNGLNTVLRLLINEKSKAMDSLKYLYGLTGGYIVARGTTKRVGEETNTEVYVTADQMKGYLRGFEKRIKDVKETSETETKYENAVAMKDTDRDFAISSYYSLKHLWDTWLISAARDQFTIQNFFNKYFIFIDSFYKNMYNTIKLNCQTILDAFNTDNANLLTFITHVTTEQRCMFFALPNFMDSNLMDNGMTTIGAYKETRKDMSYKKNNLRQMFTPYTFSEIGVPSPNNVFVFIYTHEYSSNASENTGKRFDSYMINDTNSWPAVLKDDELKKNGAYTASENNSLADDSDELVSSRYAYMMPCFGVSVNRGNNYIFKSINVNMDSPKVTAVSAQTWSDILDKTGKDGTKRIFFHGQDIFTIYQQYAYSCEIEMMGCTQVQPLMYFQLLNIPMWRGTYMIYKVTHTMQPGYMSTKFIGVKMSRYEAPYADGYYTTPKKNSQSDKQNSNSNSSSNSNAISTTSAFANRDVVTYAKSFLKNGSNEGTGSYSNSDRNFKKTNGVGDCSSFAQHVYKKVKNINIGSNTVAQMDKAISNGHLIWSSIDKPSKLNTDILHEGDLIYNGVTTDRKYKVKHVAIYIGNGKVIGWGGKGATNNPRISSLNNKAIYVGVVRYN